MVDSQIPSPSQNRTGVVDSVPQQRKVAAFVRGQGSLSIQDLINRGDAPQVEINQDGKVWLNLEESGLTTLDGLKKIPGIERVELLDLNSNQLTIELTC